MSVRDTAYTNPDNLRLLYKQPKNPLRDLDDISTIAQQIVVTSPSQPPSGGFGGNGGGNGGGGGGSGCPAVGQFTLKLIDGTHDAVNPEYVENLRPMIDWLWHPIMQIYDRVTHVSIIKDVPCVRVQTFDRAEQIVSYSHPVIQTFKDTKGRSINSMLEDLESSHSAVSCCAMESAETQIESIASVGLRDVVRITLERFGIYTCGTDPLLTIVSHNKRELGGGGGGEP